MDIIIIIIINVAFKMHGLIHLFISFILQYFMQKKIFTAEKYYYLNGMNCCYPT